MDGSLCYTHHIILFLQNSLFCPPISHYNIHFLVPKKKKKKSSILSVYVDFDSPYLVI